MIPLFSALYTGTVMHRRTRPRHHQLRYRAFWLLLDLDELPALAQSLRLFSYNKFNLFSFYDRDMGDRGGSSPRVQVEAHLEKAAIDTGGGPISVFCMPRVLGYVFNPLSIYFCYRPDGTLAAILYEVTNTFHERHSYLFAVAQDAGMPIRQSCAKTLYVSPFIDMAMTYEFRVRPPGDMVGIAIDALDAQGRVIATTLRGRRRDLTDRALLSTFWRHPLQTITIVAGIHWEGLKLWIKGVRPMRRPPAPTFPVTLGDAQARD
jgi:DUF1365 family protein